MGVKQDRDITMKDNFIAVPLLEGEDVQVLVNGEKAVHLVVPYDCALNCYIKRQAIPITYK